jgi:hypothetical protein
MLASRCLGVRVQGLGLGGVCPVLELPDQLDSPSSSSSLLVQVDVDVGCGYTVPDATGSHLSITGDNSEMACMLACSCVC